MQIFLSWRKALVRELASMGNFSWGIDFSFLNSMTLSLTPVDDNFSNSLADFGQWFLASASQSFQLDPHNRVWIEGIDVPVWGQERQMTPHRVKSELSHGLGSVSRGASSMPTVSRQSCEEHWVVKRKPLKEEDFVLHTSYFQSLS